MDGKFAEEHDRLEKMLKDDDTEGFIKLWSATVEESFIKLGKLSGKQADKYKGHGTVKIEEKAVPISGEYDKNRKEMKTTSKNREEERIGMQLGRLTAIKDAWKCLHKAKNGGAVDGSYLQRGHLQHR